jgi:flagellar hook-length control protein FliK
VVVAPQAAPEAEADAEADAEVEVTDGAEPAPAEVEGEGVAAAEEPEADGEKTDWGAVRAAATEAWRAESLSAATSFAVQKGISESDRTKMLAELDSMHTRTGVIKQEMNEGLSTPAEVRKAISSVRTQTEVNLNVLLGEELTAELKVFGRSETFAGPF